MILQCKKMFEQTLSGRKMAHVLFLGLLLLTCQFALANKGSVIESAGHKKQSHSNSIQVGAAQLAQYLPLINNKRVGLVVNQTSTIGQKHLVDVLLEHHVNVQGIFAPEHGFRGNHDAGAKVTSSIDEKTGIKLISIYGDNKKPPPHVMENFDVIIFDIQDVGVRYYTYISSMHYMMESAADAGVPFIVLDRPNPNGAFIDGPVLEKAFQSFVGMHAIPLLHGLTVGELAKMIVGEGWLASEKPLTLQVIKSKNYMKSLPYHLPIKPSPNLPNPQSVALYPSLGFFEATPISIGRGTVFPFQVIGHHQAHIGQFTFTPVSVPGAAVNPKLKNTLLTGQDLRQVKAGGLNLHYLVNWYKTFKGQGMVFFKHAKFMDKLSGTDKLRKAIIAGQSVEQIRAGWQQDLHQFKQQRKPYLLYTESKIIP